MITKINTSLNEVGVLNQINGEGAKPFLTYALKISGRGWHIFPLVPLEKRPLTSKGFHDATTDISKIKEWMEKWPNANIGVATGASGLLVIDCDYPKNGNIRPDSWAMEGVSDGADVLATIAAGYGSSFPTSTYTVKTPNKGWHIYFQDNGKPVKSSAGVNGLWLVDIRSGGGYVVAAGSVLLTGSYESGVIEEVEPCPEWIRKAITPAPSFASTKITANNYQSIGKKPVQYSEMGIKNAIAELQNATVGTRNDSLNRAAFSCGRLVKENPELHQMAFQALQVTALKIGLSELEAARTIKSAYVAGMGCV